MLASVHSESHSTDGLPVCLCPWLENPNRLVSWWDMIGPYGYSLSRMGWALASFVEISKHQFQKEADGNYRLDDQELAAAFLKSLKASLPQMRGLHLSQSCIYADRLIKQWESDGLDRVLHLNMIAILQERIHDELRSTFFLHIPPELAKRYMKPTEGWEEVIGRFPASTSDVEEMNRCLALSRLAAAVFHSVNAIECALVQLGGFLEVSDPKSGWTAISGKLDVLVAQTKFLDLKPVFQANFSFLEQLHATVAALKNAWRNKISHAQGRLAVMTADFSPEVAEEIITATRSFMRRLATEMP